MSQQNLALLDLPTNTPNPAEPGLDPNVPSTSTSGLAWGILAVIGDLSARQIPIILKAALHLRYCPSQKMATTQLSAKLKITETALVAATTAVPQLFQLGQRGTVINLRTKPPDPWDLDKKGYELLNKKEETLARAKARDEHRLLKDAEDTPFNKMRAELESLGLMRDDARKFCGHLVRTCGDSGAASLIQRAKEARPTEPKAYIMAMLKRITAQAGQAANGIPGGNSRRAQYVRATQRPDPLRTTKAIGWEASLNPDGTRNKLFRTPDGRIKRIPADVGEIIPSLDEDPGFIVSD